MVDKYEVKEVDKYEVKVVDKYEAESINFHGYIFMKYTHGSHGKIAS